MLDGKVDDNNCRDRQRLEYINQIINGCTKYVYIKVYNCCRLVDSENNAMEKCIKSDLR